MTGTPWTFSNAPDDVRRADEGLKADARRHAMGRWEPIWAESGIAAALVARHGEGGPVPTRAMAALTLSAPEDAGDLRGSVVVLRDGDLPDESNQHLRRVVHTNRSRSRPGLVDLDLGPPIPRSEWPDALRRATDPTEHAVHVVGRSVRLVDRLGLVVSEYDEAEAGARFAAAHLGGVLARFSALGHEDAREGRTRAIEVRAGRNGKGLLGRTWQVADDLGNVLEAEVRGFLRRRPPPRVSTVLAAARAAYADGQAEARMGWQEALAAARTP